AIRTELELFDPALGRRPEIVAVTKADLPSADKVREDLAAALDKPVLLISAVTGRGLNELVAAMLRAMDEQRTPA
ncbi:MAG: GTPase ObgE, partial [Thermoguttaceae bacterium]|nr:GTPase ObgE [Thermoguttaceae bacterium]